MQEIKNIYKNILVVLLNKNYLILFNGKNEIWHIKNAHVPDLCMHFQSVPHNQNIKKCMFDNEFHLLLNTTNILMHVSLGIITKYLMCGI